MKARITYDDAVDLLDADHKAVKKMFIDHAVLCDDEAPAATKRVLAQRICQALAVHAQIEEEIFYPQVREAIGDDAPMDEALQQHADARAVIAVIVSKKTNDAERDAAVRQLSMLVDLHVLEEREVIFLQARRAAVDLRGMTLPLLQRQQQLKKKADAVTAQEAA